MSVLKTWCSCFQASNRLYPKKDCLLKRNQTFLVFTVLEPNVVFVQFIYIILHHIEIIQSGVRSWSGAENITFKRHFDFVIPPRRIILFTLKLWVWKCSYNFLTFWKLLIYHTCYLLWNYSGWFYVIGRYVVGLMSRFSVFVW